jgi:hypothetical protein
VTDAKPETILRLLAKLDVVRDDGTPASAEPETTVIIGIGIQMKDTREDGTRRPLSELFQPEDVIDVIRGCDPLAPESTELMVRRPLSQGVCQMYRLPCDVSDLPPNTKITPEALEFIRQSRTLPAIDVQPVSASGAGNYETDPL